MPLKLRIGTWTSEEEFQTAAVRYLLYGELQERVLSFLIPLEARPPWLQDFVDVHQMLEDLCEEPWRRQRLLGALFPNSLPLPRGPVTVGSDRL